MSPSWGGSDAFIDLYDLCISSYTSFTSFPAMKKHPQFQMSAQVFNNSPTMGS